MIKQYEEMTTKIVETFEKIYHFSTSPISLHAPIFEGNEWKYLKECLDSQYVSSVGNFVVRFEEELKKLTGAEHVIATVNGTAALHTSLMVAGIQENDEVLTSPLSFIATTNTIRYCQATPHFVDIQKDSLAVDPNKLRDYLRRIALYSNGKCINKNSKRPIKALCVTHIFGHPADLDALLNVCEEFGLLLLEDAAEALGSYYKGKHVGAHGVAGALSFNGNKITTTGGGGATLTNDAKFAETARHITTQAKLTHPWNYVHDRVGYNYRMPNINAALGCAQLEQINLILQEKRKLAEYYKKIFENQSEYDFMTEPVHCKSNYWLNALILKNQNPHCFQNLIQKLHQKQWFVRPLWTLHHRLNMYHTCPKMDLSVAESFEDRVINIPSSAFLTRMIQDEYAENMCGDRIPC